MAGKFGGWLLELRCSFGEGMAVDAGPGLRPGGLQLPGKKGTGGDKREYQSFHKASSVFATYVNPN